MDPYAHRARHTQSRRRVGRDTRRLTAAEQHPFPPAPTVPVDRDVLERMLHLVRQVAAAPCGQLPVGTGEQAQSILDDLGVR